MQHQLGQYNQAIDYFQQALRIHRHIASPRNKALILVNLAASQQALEEFREALQTLREARQICIENDPITMHSKVLNVTGLTYMNHFMLDSAAFNPNYAIEIIFGLKK